MRRGVEHSASVDEVAVDDLDRTGSPIDDTIAGDRAMAEQIETRKKPFTAAVFASRGYRIDEGR